MTVAILLTVAVAAYLAAAAFVESKEMYTRRQLVKDGWQVISFTLVVAALVFAWIERGT